MKLNHNYDRKTRLWAWWKQVKANFQMIEAYANSVDTLIEKETREQQNADANLQQKITEEARRTGKRR